MLADNASEAATHSAQEQHTEQETMHHNLLQLQR
jgi:hypothetical protein